MQRGIDRGMPRLRKEAEKAAWEELKSAQAELDAELKRAVAAACDSDVSSVAGEDAE